MKFKSLVFTSVGFIVLIALANSLMSCSNADKGTDVKRDASKLKLYGDQVKVYEESKSYDKIYADNGNDIKLSTIAADYLGRFPEILNLNQLSKDYKADYIEYQYIVDELPIDLKGFNSIFTKEERTENKGKKVNVIAEFAKKNDLGIRSQHTMLVDFPMLANSEKPTVKYGFDKKKGNQKEKLHIKKIKSVDFHFEGSESKYYIGAKKPFRNESLTLKYNSSTKKYSFKTDTASDNLDMDRIEQLNNGSTDPLFDDMKYCAIVNNIKTAQNKYINSGGYYKVPGLFRFLSSMEINADFPLRKMHKGEALMRHFGSSLADGQSYVKFIMDDTQIGLLIDVDGYITQYQQVIVDKAKGIVEKTVLIKK